MKALQWVVVASVSCVTMASVAAPDQSSDKRVVLIVPYAPGGQTDNAARLLAKQMTSTLGQAVIVENRTGGGGAVGTKALINAAPDGSSIMLNTASTHLLPMLNPRVGYDADTQLQPIARLTSAPMILVVRADSNWKSLGEMVAAGKTKSVTYSSSGVGTTNHLAGELLASLTGIKAIHVPYRGGPQVTQAVLAGEVDFAIDTVVSTMPLIKAGRLRALGKTAPSSLPELASIPTISEGGYPTYLATTWTGAYAPAATPASVVARLQDAFSKALKDPEVAEHLRQMGSPAAFLPAAEFKTTIAGEKARYGNLIKVQGIRLEQ